MNSTWFTQDYFNSLCDKKKNHIECNFIDYEEIDSTNLECRRRLETEPDITAPLLITSRMQTMGRGRQGKSFSSPMGGLYMSLLTSPKADMQSQVHITTATSVAVAKGIYDVCGLDCGIKWVNDIYCNGKKLCGILAEAINDYDMGITKNIINGIGVNISSFPENLNATCILNETGKIPDVYELAANIAYNLLSIYDMISKNDFSYMDEYRKRSVIIGKEIIYYKNGVGCNGYAYDIDDMGGLYVRDENGVTEILSSGEITVRMAK